MSNNKMLIQVIILVVLAIIIALCQHYATMCVHGLLMAHDWISSLFSYVFSGSSVGHIIQECLSFMVLPFVIACIIAIIYAVIKKSFLPCFMLIVWFVWLVMVTGLLMR